MTPWLRNPRPDARFRLLCFPYAGGGSADFRTWAPLVPTDVEVLPLILPGRENRLGEPPRREMSMLVRDAAAEILPLLRSSPYALFGHSMGSWVAFEFAREVRRLGGPPPRRLFASGRRAPHLPDRLPLLHALPEPEFLTAVQDRYQAIPPQLLAEPEILKLFLPALRADFTLLDTYACAEGAPLDVPFSVWAGADDGLLLRHELQAWELHTSRGAHLRLFPGGHFYLRSAREALVPAILEALELRV